jgi:hypothetical protein
MICAGHVPQANSDRGELPERRHFSKGKLRRRCNGTVRVLLSKAFGSSGSKITGVATTRLAQIAKVQGGSNMTGTICVLTCHSLSRSYLNHLVICSLRAYEALAAAAAAAAAAVVVVVNKSEGFLDGP